MLHKARDPVRSPAYRTGALVLFAAALVIAGALAFEHLGGLAPCPLCLQQRYAYYAGVPALFLALVLTAADRPRLAAVLFGLVAAAFLANAGLGAYHAGVEWKLWAGPETCAATGARPLGSGKGGVLDSLSATRVVRCDEAPWQFLGLSLAGWNVIASLLLAAGAASAALKAIRS
jgi:disulfide bond formation protein DsbB